MHHDPEGPSRGAIRRKLNLFRGLENGEHHRNEMFTSLHQAFRSTQILAEIVDSVCWFDM